MDRNDGWDAFDRGFEAMDRGFDRMDEAFDQMDRSFRDNFRERFEVYSPSVREAHQALELDRQPSGDFKRRFGEAALDAVNRGYEAQLASRQDVGGFDQFAGVSADDEVARRTELGAIIDMDTAQACSLTAGQIRKSLRKQFQAGTDSHRVGDIRSADVIDLGFDGMQLRTDQVDDDRRVISLGSAGDTQLFAWTDKPQKWRGLKDDMSDDALKQEPFVIGVGEESHDGQSDIFVPVVVNYLTDSGCNMVIPCGSETDELAFNRTLLLDQLRPIVLADEHERELYHGGRKEFEIENMLTTVIDALSTSEEGVGLQSFLEHSLGQVTMPAKLTNLRDLLDGDIDDIPTREITVTTTSADEHQMVVLGQPLEEMQMVGQSPQQMEYFLQDCGLVPDGDTGLHKRRYMLWGGLDPDEYDDSVLYPRMAVDINEFGMVDAQAYSSTGVPDGDPSDQQMADFTGILEHKLGEMRQKREHQALYPERSVVQRARRNRRRMFSSILDEFDL